MKRILSLAVLLLVSIYAYNQCNITSIFAEPHPCDDNGQFLIDLEFDYTNEGSIGFMVEIVGGSAYGPFEYGQSFYTIGPVDGDCMTNYKLFVVDVEFSTCLEDYTLPETVCCEECVITAITVDPIACDGDDTYSILLDFDYVGNTNDHFDVFSDRELVGYFAYADLPITIDHFPERDADYDIITICDNDNPSCCGAHEFMGLDCDESGGCHIWDVSAEFYDCNDEGQFYVDIEFLYDNVGREGFVILGNGHNYGEFQYGQEFYTLGPLEINCDLMHEFVIIDNEFEDCGGEFYFESPACCNEEGCMFFDIVVEPLHCADDGTYSIGLNFEYSGMTNDYFEVWSGDMYLGYYLFTDLPVIIEGVIDREVEYDIIRICQNDVPDCCQEHEFIGLDCDESGGCHIWDVSAEFYDCNDEGQFYVDIEFLYDNVGREGFVILGNGHNYGEFQYGQEFYTLGPLEINCDLMHEFVIIDNEFEDCGGEFYFESPACCDEEGCMFFDIVVEPLHCADDGTYSIGLNFEYSGMTNDYFEVWSGDMYLGFYLFTDLPVIIEGVIDREVEYDIIRICQNDVPDCCQEYEFMGLDCDESECSIEGLEVWQIECDGGDFYINLDLNYGEVNGDHFTVVGNGMDHGEYSYNDLPITIGPLPSEVDWVWDFVACDVEYSDCCDAVEFGSTDCFQGPERPVDKFIAIKVTSILVQITILDDIDWAQFDLFDIQGKRIDFLDENQKGSFDMNIESLRPAVYFLSLKSSEGNKLVKFLKM